MTSDPPARPVLLCFDGSEDSAGAIAASAELLGPREAVVVTVCEPISIWEPYDPGAILSAAVAKLTEKQLGLEEIAHELAQEKLDHGIELARAAGFAAGGQVAHGKTWRAICDTADKLDAAPIVLGARGLSRVESAVLGSVSACVLAHTKRPVLVIPRHAGRSGVDAGGSDAGGEG
jgi:nucleotide-binding universal stress UspA family protein